MASKPIIRLKDPPKDPQEPPSEPPSTSTLEKCTDTDVGKMIHLPLKKLITHESKYLPKGDGVFLLISGRTGCGKSVLLRKLIPMFTSQTKYIIIATKLRDVDAHKAVMAYCKEFSLHGHMVYDSDEFYRTLAGIIKEKKKEDRILVIFDDFSDYKAGSRTDSLNSTQINTFCQLRNYQASGVSITQAYQNFDTFVRGNSRIKVTFPMDCRHSVIAIRNEFCDMFPNVDPKFLREIFDKAYEYTQTHKFTYLTMYSDPPRLCLGFDKQVYPQEDRAGNADHPNDEELDPDFDWARIKHLTKTGDTKGKGLAKRQQLRKLAKELGFPTNGMSKATNAILEQFIKLKTAQGQQGAGNDNPELQKIIEHAEKTSHIEGAGLSQHPESLKRRLYKLVHKWDTRTYRNKHQLFEDLRLVVYNLLEQKIIPLEDLQHLMKVHQLETIVPGGLCPP